uniref:DZF domain-containing protein n=1 Tax=Ciona savignyi TaxID=51511 RepID=H2YD69_CIOSA
MILTSVSAPIVTVHVTLTSTTMRQIPNADAEESATKSKKPDPPDILDHHKCCEALATLRRAKWFQAKVSPHQTCVIICRIIRSFACQPHSWNPWKLLNSWVMELLTERIYSNAINTITPTTCLQRVLEVLSAGILLEEGTGLRDPCEKEPTDVLANLNLQQKEDITKGAQHFLRLLVFGKMHELLGVELPDSQVRKRAADQEDTADQSSKKGKIE